MFSDQGGAGQQCVVRLISVFLTMITTYGVEKNKYASLLVQNEITLDDFFI